MITKIILIEEIMFKVMQAAVSYMFICYMWGLGVSFTSLVLNCDDILISVIKL